MDGRTVICANIHARMKRTFTGERVDALAKTIRDVAEYRPNRRGVTGIRKGARGHQAKSARGNSDCCSVALEEGILLEGAVKGVFGSGGESI